MAYCVCMCVFFLPAGVWQDSSMATWVECLQYSHACVFIRDYESFYVYEMCSRHGKSVFMSERL